MRMNRHGIHITTLFLLWQLFNPSRNQREQLNYSVTPPGPRPPRKVSWFLFLLSPKIHSVHLKDWKTVFLRPPTSVTQFQHLQAFEIHHDVAQPRERGVSDTGLLYERAEVCPLRPWSDAVHYSALTPWRQSILSQWEADTLFGVTFLTWTTQASRKALSHVI